MFCPRCGNKIEDGKKFCSKCGNKIINGTTENFESAVKPQESKLEEPKVERVQAKETEYKSVESKVKEAEYKLEEPKIKETEYKLEEPKIKETEYKPEAQKIKETEYKTNKTEDNIEDSNEATNDGKEEKKVSFIVPAVIVAVCLVIGYFIYSSVIKPTGNTVTEQIVEYEYTESPANNIDDNSYNETPAFSDVNVRNNFLTSQITYTNPITNYDINTMVNEVDTITLGRYPQLSGNEPIEWIVLEKDELNHRALLLSKYVLDCQSYNGVRGPITWEFCSLRQWLNDGFYHLAFNEDEKSIIELSEVDNYNNPTYRTDGGNATYDKVFLLSIDEATRYFNQYSMQSDNYRLATSATNYAKNVNNMGDRLFVNDRNEWCIGNSWFWLRSPANAQDCAASINSNGYLDEVGDPVNATKGGVRPAIWVSY